MDKKNDFRLITMVGEYINSQFIQEEGEDINKQVSFDFHTCFDAQSLLLKEQETSEQLRQMGSPQLRQTGNSLSL